MTTVNRKILLMEGNSQIWGFRESVANDKTFHFEEDVLLCTPQLASWQHHIFKWASGTK